MVPNIGFSKFQACHSQKTMFSKTPERTMECVTTPEFSLSDHTFYKIASIVRSYEEGPSKSAANPFCALASLKVLLSKPFCTKGRQLTVGVLCSCQRSIGAPCINCGLFVVKGWSAAGGRVA